MKGSRQQIKYQIINQANSNLMFIPRNSQSQNIRNQFNCRFPAEQSNSTLKRDFSYKDLNLLIDIPCLNCDQLIDYQDVDQHSRICTQVKSRVMLLEKPKTSNTAMRVQQRGKALFQAIQKKIQRQSNLLPIDQSYLQAIANYTKQLLQIRDYDKSSLIKCRKLWQDLMFLYGSPLDQQSGGAPDEQFNGSPATMIYLDRLRNLVRQKYAQMRVALSELLKNQRQQAGSELLNKSSILGQQKSRVTSSLGTALSNFKQRSIYNLHMIGPSSQLASIMSDQTLKNQRQQQLEGIKQLKKRQIKDAVGQQQRTIEIMMRKSAMLNNQQKEKMADQLKSIYLRPTQSPKNLKNLAFDFQRNQGDQHNIIFDLNSEVGGGTGLHSLQSSSKGSYASRSNAGESSKDYYMGRGLMKIDQSKERNDDFYCKSISEKSPEKDLKMKLIDQVIIQQDSKKRQQIQKDMRINFAQQFAKMKQHFPDKHQAHQVPFDALYQAAKSQKLPPTQWPEFIMRELKHNAKSWIDPSRLQKLQKILEEKNMAQDIVSSQYQKRLRQSSFQAIAEEQNSFCGSPIQGLQTQRSSRQMR